MAMADLMKVPAFVAFRTREDVGEQLRLTLARQRIEQSSRWQELLELCDAVYDGVVEVKDMPELLAQAFGLDSRHTAKLTRDLVAVQLLPMKDVMQGLGDQIAAWGGMTANTEGAGEKPTYDEYAEIIAARANLALALHHLRRLGHLVKQYLTAKKTRDETAAFLTRPVVIGGLGFTPEQSATVLQLVDDDKGKVEVVEEVANTVAQQPEDFSDALALANRPSAPQEGAAEPSPCVPEIAPSHALATSTPIAVGAAVAGLTLPSRNLHDDAAEIARHAKTMAKKGLGTMTNEERLEAAVAAAVDAAAPTLAEKRIAKTAFADIARMAVKGVRDPYQTRAVLERDYQLWGEPLLLLMEAIMQGMEVWNAKEESGKRKEEREETVRLEQEVLDKRFAEKVGAMPTEAVAPVMPEARVSAARTKEEERAEQAAKVDAQKVLEAEVASKPEPAKAMLTVGSVPPPPKGEVPMVTDVQFRPRLVGPVEELGTMTPAEFRRLSSNPVEAARKVEDALHALEATSFDDRIQGVQAWRRSPVNALYAAMAAEALNNGIALAEVATRRRNKGEESLSPAELAAIASLNARIRF